MIKNNSEPFYGRYNRGLVSLSPETILDNRLDYVTKGVYVTLFSVPSDWEFSIKALVELVDDKNVDEKTIANSIQKLEKLGYLQKLPASDNKNNATDFDYKITIAPQI